MGEEREETFLSRKTQTEYIKPNFSGFLAAMTGTDNIQDIDSVSYLRIELDSKIVLVVNSSRKTAISLAQKKYGLREFASKLTRFTGNFGQRRGDSGEGLRGSYSFDKELASSLAEDLAAIHNNKEFNEMPRLDTIDPEYDFL